jgi:hypothetical protein
VPIGLGGYREQWEQARKLLDARRRVRDFPGAAWTGRTLCSLSPRWPAEPAPPGLKEHQKDTLSAANWVKRRWRQMQDLDGFPSTSSVASARYRQAVLARLGDRQVRAAVGELTEAAGQVVDTREAAVAGLPAVEGQPGSWFRSSAGPWVYPGQWQAEPLARETGTEPDSIGGAVTRGAAAARQLAEIMKDQHGMPGPASYLAVLVQDLDGMGRFLSGQGTSAAGTGITVSAEDHTRVSGQLRELAASQRRVLQAQSFLGVPVYAGGDDLLAFTPAATALAAARACHDAIPASLPTASTAVLFFHYQARLQSAMARAREMLEQAKASVPGKHALAIGYLRRSGAAGLSIQPWSDPDGGSAAALFGIFAADRAHPLSPQLVTELERDGTELAGLGSRDLDLYLAELRRLVRRHIRAEPGTGDAVGSAGVRAAADAAAARAADALALLGNTESARGASRPESAASGRRPERAARIGVFLRQEAR